MKSATLTAQVALFSVILSSAFIAVAIALNRFDPYTLLTVRFFISSLLIFILIRIIKAVPVDFKMVKYGLLLGLLNNAIYLGFIFAVLQKIRSQIVIVIVSCAPIATTMLSAWCGLEKISFKKLLGACLGLVGAIVITSKSSDTPIDMIGVSMATIGMMAFASGIVLLREK